LGKVDVLVDTGSKFCSLDFTIVGSSLGDTTILGFPGAKQLGLVNISDSVKDNAAKSYSQVFGELGCLPCKHALQLKPDAHSGPEIAQQPN